MELIWRLSEHHVHGHGQVLSWPDLGSQGMHPVFPMQSRAPPGQPMACSDYSVAMVCTIIGWVGSCLRAFVVLLSLMVQWTGYTGLGPIISDTPLLISYLLTPSLDLCYAVAFGVGQLDLAVWESMDFAGLSDVVLHRCDASGLQHWYMFQRR